MQINAPLILLIVGVCEAQSRCHTYDTSGVCNNHPIIRQCTYSAPWCPGGSYLSESSLIDEPHTAITAGKKRRYCIINSDCITRSTCCWRD
ncbi:hypothetical protein PTTW11_04430 [Pyrenophora teres f. teres]|uniref:Uncharacterized protein n=1 Tax=Pyrenophora teres f. teres TaxID=97479 RepID=A0A6S6VZH5_9PLEO|nr:hypothetical protein PTTW11_04430 [Pyrenophora teres f. teres]